jgi:hypothetical protein
MFVIHKYPISLSADVQYISMPADAQVLHVGMQNGVICLWAKHEVEYLPGSTASSPNNRYRASIFVRRRA